MSEFSPNYLYLIPLLPLVGFILNSLMTWGFAHHEKKASITLVGLIGCLLPITAFALSLWGFLVLRTLPEGSSFIAPPLFNWLSTSIIKIDFSFMLDPLNSVMLLIITGVGSLIHIYSVGYMEEDKSFSRYFSYLNLFLFFMLVLVLANNLLVLFVGWEGVGLCSYLLIGFWFTDIEKAKAGKKAFVVNRIGDFGFMIGLFFIVSIFSSHGGFTDLNFLNYSFIQDHKDLLAPMIVVITLCLFVGATGKSAQIPLYVWLPDAMAGPTPVSALIHAATMVTAGVYMISRLYFLFALAPLTLHVIASIGLATAFMSALIAITQTDIKKVLAYSTVSQLGFMFLSLGVGSPEAAIFHVMTHAFFKACLFLCSGSVIYALHHEQDIRKMGGLFKKLPITGFAFLISTLAISGIPPFSGFFSKDEILFHTFADAPRLFYYGALLTAGLTAFYMFRLFAYVFMGESRGPKAHHVPLIMDLPVLILAILAAVGGFVGIPEVLGGHDLFHHWLFFPDTTLSFESPSTEMKLMALSTGWALFMSLLALTLYSKNLDWAKNLRTKFHRTYELLYNKFYIDEIYDCLIVRPIYFISDKLLWKVSDVKLIDGLLVHGGADVASLGARIVTRIQTGILGNYLLYLWVGLILLLVFVVKT